MWALHKISSILRKPRPTKPFFDSLSRTFLAKLDESTSKITEGRRTVIFRRKYKQFAKIDAKLVTVGMYSDLWVYIMNIIINKHVHSLFILTFMVIFPSPWHLFFCHVMSWFSSDKFLATMVYLVYILPHWSMHHMLSIDTAFT